MLRNLVAATVCWLAAASTLTAQDWAVKMFNTTAHDFGKVARGTKSQFRFQIKNIYEEDAHIQLVQSSCGCTVPQLTKADLKTFETAEIIADFNTREFLGHKAATIRVVFDKPFHAEVQLHVKGDIRSDVVLQPGAIDLGTVDVGHSVEKKLLVTYSGPGEFRILDVKTADPHFEVEMRNVTQQTGQLSTELLVRLTNDAPVGYIKDQLILVTTDQRNPEISVELQGRVVSDITISPSQLFLGVVQPGKTVKKTLVVRGKKPFKIVDVKCPDKAFEIDAPKEAKVVHVIPVLFTAGADPGRVAQKISITTDQGGVVQAFTAFAEVVKPGSSEATEPTLANEGAAGSK